MPRSQETDYFDIVREGIHHVSDTPLVVEVRVDPDSEKVEERIRQHQAQYEQDRRASRASNLLGQHMEHLQSEPPTKRLHLQWRYDAEDPGWSSEILSINLATKRLTDHGAGNPLLGRQRAGSGAIGVVVFASPVLLLLSPFLIVRSRAYAAREARAGMSRHAIALLDKLREQLDRETTSLLEEVFKNEWQRAAKLDRRPSFDEAHKLLLTCHLDVSRFGEASARPYGEARHWFDDHGDRIAAYEYEDGQTDPPRLRVCGRVFLGRQARSLLDVCKSRIDQSDDT